jgi:AcrR family transcriptional regulator
MSVQSRPATAPRRRRRTYLAADDRRAQILVAAKQVFAREGYHHASIEQICELAEIARGTLYQYFENKHDLLRAFVAGVAERLEALVLARPRLSKIPNLERADFGQIKVFCRARMLAALQTIFVDQDTFKILLAEARGGGGTVDEVLADIDATLVGAIEDDIRAAQRAGLIRALPAPLVARYLLGGIEKLVLGSLASETPIDLGRIVDTALEIQLLGLLTEKVVKS